jgi:hypothetical protein
MRALGERCCADGLLRFPGMAASGAGVLVSHLLCTEMIPSCSVVNVCVGTGWQLAVSRAAACTVPGGTVSTLLAMSGPRACPPTANRQLPTANPLPPTRWGAVRLSNYPPPMNGAERPVTAQTVGVRTEIAENLPLGLVRMRSGA